jgi:DNA-binding transcriptional LysR family regulator
LRRFLPDYPDINVEISADYALVDIVAERFDAGVRLGEQVDRDMISVRIGPDIPVAVVAAPSYFDRHAPPKVPQDLIRHQCINLRLSPERRFNAWAFAKQGRELSVHVRGPLAFNTLALIGQAALDGFGLAYLLEDQVEAHLAAGRLVRVLEDWCRPLSGYHLYYPSRRQAPPAFALLVDALRYRA